jgi:polyisoprenoid-binding protein YceI
MNRITIAIMAGLLLIFGGKTLAADWAIDHAHSSMNFSVKHLVIATVNGTFTDFDGTISFDPNDLSTIKADVTAQIASVNTNNEKRDGHLRTSDFFDAENYPTMEFKSTSAKQTAPGKAELMGDLTIRGVTKPVTFEVEGFNQTVEAFGATKTAGTATATINRMDYGVAWDAKMETGNLIAGETVTI